MTARQRAFEPEGLLAPPAIRELVLERDGHCCRICGRYVEIPHLHHINYRSGGGANTPANLITLDWYHHLHTAHGNKRLWQPILQQLTVQTGITGFQLLRWTRRVEESAALSGNVR